MCLPLPPLPEQQRIVDLVERLFAKLDEAKEKVQTAIDSFELRKAAILHKAFTGELTRRWREEKERRAESERAGEGKTPSVSLPLASSPSSFSNSGGASSCHRRTAPKAKLLGEVSALADERGLLYEQLDNSTAEGVAIQTSQFSTLNSQLKNDQPYPIPETWQWVKLQDLCKIPITDGTHQTPTYCEEAEGIPFISSKDVTSQHIKWDKIKYITKDLHEELYKRIAPQKNDILLAKNGTTGVAAMVETDKVFDIYVTLAVLRPNTNCIFPKYLYRVINSLVCKRQFDEHLTGIGVPNLHLRDIKVTNIPLPPLAEQKEIVRILDTLLEKSDKAKELAENALENIETLKKTILAKAFRGLLGTNRADEESSLELLKQVL
ncbi:MAG: restriction endonuclease subunit S [Candidatus Riflebacteria bacterium]|nr:restriction endonuclease subunit S [Candidatus Riflebacteria bacterium]